MTARPDQPHIGIVVEGPGDRGAIPTLLRRYLHADGEFRDILGNPVPCNGRSNATRQDGVEGYVATAAGRPGCVGVLVVLDADDDPVCQLGPALRARALAITGKPVLVCLAERTFEDWLDSAFESLDLGDRPNVGSGVAAIKFALKPGAYIKPVWQPRLAGRVDIEAAKANSVSLARLLDRFEVLRGLLPI